MGVQGIAFQGIISPLRGLLNIYLILYSNDTPSGLVSVRIGNNIFTLTSLNLRP
jgi:hypothetical protein